MTGKNKKGKTYTMQTKDYIRIMEERDISEDARMYANDLDFIEKTYTDTTLLRQLADLKSMLTESYDEERITLFEFLTLSALCTSLEMDTYRTFSEVVWTCSTTK